MIKVFHVIAIGALISSAMYAYTIKYETLYHGEQLSKLKQSVQKEREAIAVLKAEWQHLNRPDRLQMLSERHLSLQPLATTQLARFSDVPVKGPKFDGIGQKLESLGLMGDDIPTASIVRGAPRAATAAATPRPIQPRAAAAASRPVALTPRPATSAGATSASANSAGAAARQAAASPASARPLPPRPVPVAASQTASTTLPRPPMRLQQ